MLSRHLPYQLHLPLAAVVLLGGIFPAFAPVSAQTGLQCQLAGSNELMIRNQAGYTYGNGANKNLVSGASNLLQSTFTRQKSAIALLPRGITNEEGAIIGVGVIANTLTSILTDEGFSVQEVEQANRAALSTFVNLADNTSTEKVTTQVKEAIAQAVPHRQTNLESVTATEIILALSGMGKTAFVAAGLTQEEAQTARATATETLVSTSTNLPFEETWRQANEAAMQAVSEKADSLAQIEESLKTELNNLRAGVRTSLEEGDTLNFHFVLTNIGETSLKTTIPDASSIQQTGITGSASVTKVSYEVASASGETPVSQGETTTAPTSVTLRPQEELKLTVGVEVGAISRSEPTTFNLNLGSDGCGEASSSQQSVALLPPADNPPVDPLGLITGCAGEILPDYRGFYIALYEADPNDPTGGLGKKVSLTRTELPDQSGNQIPEGIEPNQENNNPFYLTNEDRGNYSFLLDESRGQLDQGSTYILMVKPSEDSSYDERRIRVVIGDRTGNLVTYTATSLDGKPIGTTDERTSVNGVVEIDDAETIGLNLAVLDMAASVCDAEDLSITKTGDHAAAEPGDIVIYRLSIRSLASAAIEDLEVTDVLPRGLNFKPEAVRGELAGEEVEINTQYDERTITFTPPGKIEQGQVLNIVYAAEITPDALRGNGRNSALIEGDRTDNGLEVKDGPVFHQLEIRPGIVADCGTIIGRVFEDKNFDGEQQPGEPGIPNAVIFLQDGNRITTDADGFFPLLMSYLATTPEF